MPRRPKRRKTATDSSVADEPPPAIVNTSPVEGKPDIDAKMKDGGEEHTLVAAESDEVHIDTTSNASEAPTFDDIDPTDPVDRAIFEEEQVPYDDADDAGVTHSKRNGHISGKRQGGGFNALKSFHGQIYTGMAIGGSHTWNYDQGVWKETKVEPDLWKIDYETTKRRARNAPKGSGAPVGTEYHWLIVAHQHVKKTDANTYTTHLVGSKYKLAHKNANATSWSVPTVKAQREREIELLEDAKRRVQGLPPVLAGERVKVEKGTERGQQKLDALFSMSGKVSGSDVWGGKRKRSEVEGEGEGKGEEKT
ncbi:hypothetical protein Z517_06884 [Fonsecaea pedrosoi CBS 271.37]|uniref:Unplaced genomic scaffold supercont1.4, whole genome shotgun sequence n=1 Tax=Fonsecaea pedrosoi CBS 271.37 TaxID=1442368 RepID=A0A0D2H6G4_9EURO|nr:uncharacterized protein Z517_06884 [Fonsecaea pedrosoi CBS 271.37]KIW80269.1 hypothetical protein Z517_06884 [Fonsecaea pedrosoi CBS 271.37]